MRRFIHSLSRLAALSLFGFLIASPLPLKADDEIKPTPASPVADPSLPTIRGEPSTVSAQPKESVSHLVLFQGPKDIVNDWMINSILQQDITLSDPHETIVQEYVIGGSHTFGGTNTFYRKSDPPTPFRIFVKGIHPARDNGIIVALELKSDKEISKAELEELFVKYLKAVDQKLMVPAQGLEKDILHKADFLKGQIHIANRNSELQRQESSNRRLQWGTSIGQDALSNYEMELQRDLAKNGLEIAILDIQLASLKKSIADGKAEPANDRPVEGDRLDVLLGLSNLEAARTQAIGKLGADHPDIKALDEKIESFKTRFARELTSKNDVSKRPTLIHELEESLKSRESSMIKKEHLDEQMKYLTSLKVKVTNSENIKASLDLEIKAAEERIEKLQRQLLELDDISYHIIHDRLNRNEMGMITILDPAPAPKPSAQEAKPAEKAKPAEEKPATP